MPLKIIPKILAQITPERIEAEIKAVEKINLPANFEQLVKEYEKVGGKRKDFIWKWFLKVQKLVNDPFKEVVRKKSLLEAKFLITLFIILLDDIADQKKNKKLLDELLKIPISYKQVINFKGLSSQEIKYLKFTLKIWKAITSQIKKYPRYKEFETIFEYNIVNAINSIKYDYLINKNHYLINKTEARVYPAYSMQVIIHFILNLMCAPKFNIRNYYYVIEVGWEAQKMARIGNWISTWEREIQEEDFTSGIFAYSINSKIISSKELDGNKQKIINKIKKADVENELFSEWEECYNKILNLKARIKTINIQEFLKGLEQLLILEVVSKTHK